MASIVEAGYVLEPVRLWPDRTMRAKVRGEMPGSEDSCPSHEPERTLVREPSCIVVDYELVPMD